jgi:Spy/CpxP family protein refolding chaperone
MSISHLRPHMLTFAFLLSAPLTWGFSPDDAPPGSPPNEARMEERMARMDKELGLTAEQRKKLKEHRQSHRGEAKKFFEEIRTKREALREELEKPDFDKDKVKALNEELKALQNRMADHRLEGILEVREILTPEQFKRFHEMAGERRQKHMGQGEGKREHRGPSPEDEGDGSPPSHP